VYVLTWLFGFLLEQPMLIASTVGVIVPIFTTPIGLIGLTLLYFDLRLRKASSSNSGGNPPTISSDGTMGR
jgi:hypothetical protein